MSVETQKRLRLGLGAIFFTLLLVYGGQLLSRSLAALQMESDPGFSVLQVRNRVLVTEISTPESRSELRPLDEVVTIEGHEVKSVNDFPTLFDNIKPDTPFSVVVKRNGRLVSIFGLTSRPIPFSSWLISGVARVVIPQIFLLTGLVVFLLRPNDKQALLLALMFGMFIGAIMSINPPFAGEPPWLVGIMLVVHLSSMFLWPVFFHFFQIFPEPTPLLSRFPKLERWLYLPHLLTIFPCFAALNILAAFSPESFFAFRNQFSPLITLSIFVATAYIAGGLLSLLINYRQASLASRRKMRVIVAGTIAGFLPMFLEIALAIAFNLPRTNPVLGQWLGVAALFAFPLFPLSFAYAIVRHRVIPVRLIVRRSVRYLLISRGFILIQAVSVFAVLSFLLTGRRLALIDSYGARADIVVTMAATALAIALLTFLNQRVMPVIDRRFFREAYDAQQILADLGFEVRRAKTGKQVVERAAAKVQDALHVATVAIFLRDRNAGDFACAVWSHLSEQGASTDDPSGLTIPARGLTCRRLKQSSFTQTLDCQRSRSWLAALDSEHEEDPVLADERMLLRLLRCALIVPVATKDELLGIISLGPRLGDLPYSREDKQLLLAVAWQLAFAVQNAQLIEEAAEQEKLRHELAIATRVQRRLFPERPPQFEKLELAGVCLPALGVGGDYYDFLVLDQHKVGIAVADVAGKGISAALLMSTVQASLRSQAPSVNGNLVKLVSSMNRLLHGSTDVSNYATFFYAQFDERSGLLTYVNAGHNPPMLVRAQATALGRGATGGSIAQPVGQMIPSRHSGPIEIGSTEFRRLTVGGPLIGAFDECDYEQQTLQLFPGDMIVAYTDGVTEAVNSSDEEFGEDQLRELIASSLPFTAEEMTQHIVSRVQEWCGDRPQQDDLTMVVMKVRATAELPLINRES
jgi:sigma-B regulation protein RsbU (phosphoserine phosphatase)